MVAKNPPFDKDQQDVIDRFVRGEIPLIEKDRPLEGYFAENRVLKLSVEDAKTDD